MAQVQIRRCTEQDIDAVVALERQWEQEDIAYGDFNPMDASMVRAVLERFPDYFFVAEHDGGLVGYVHGTLHRTTPSEVIPADEPYLEIENIYVQPEFRSQDVGGALLEQLIDVAQSAGVQRFVVGTRSKEIDRILRFYRSHGFQAWSIQFFR